MVKPAFSFQFQKCRAALICITLAGMGLGELISPATPLDPAATIRLTAASAPRAAQLLGVTNFSFAGSNFSGKLLSQVWADDSSNPWGGLTFRYRLVSSGDCDTELGWLSLRGFSGLLVDANYFGGGVVPRKAWRSASGDLVAFGFFDEDGEAAFETGDSSAWLILQTNAREWTVSPLVGLGDEVVGGAAFTPAVVPEPTAVSLLCLAAVTPAVRRKQP